MDLQKVAAQANAAANQRSEGAKEGTGMFATPFADMIRIPAFMAGGVFGPKDGQEQKAESVSETPKDVEKPDNQRTDHQKNNDDDDRRVEVRDDPRDDKVRAGDRSDDHADDSTPRSSDDNHDSSGDENGAEHTEDEDAPQQADADDAGGEEITETNTANDANDPSTSAETGQDNIETVVIEQHADVTIDATFDPALDGLLAATQGDNTVKDAAQVLKTAAAGPKVATVTDGTEVTNANGEQAKQQQQAQTALERVGIQSPNNANAEAAKATIEQPLAEQQAKALADSLKSDKTVKINVNVDNRAGTAVSQTTQSLNANAIAAQEAVNGQAARANASQKTAGDTIQQAPQARVDGNAAIPGQTQALNQVTQGNANAAAESGLTRAAAQISNAGPQASHGGGEGANATTPGGSVNTQQTANAQRAQQVQTPQTPQQARPLAHQISVNISKAVSEGLDRISIQLRPDNLGRVEVKLEVAQNGRVNANIIVDRPETLELLRNDSRNLERALQDAGLDTQSGDLSFNLRDQQENPDESQSDNHMANGDDNVDDGNLEAEMATRLLNGDIGDIISDMRVDIRA